MTIIEIAKQLGVSTSTVSRALNDSHQISKATRNKVNEFVKEVNFHRNPQATSLKAGSTRTIAVIIPDISNHFFTLALNAIEDIATNNKFHVLIYQTHENHDREVEIVNELYNGRVDGVLISVAGSINEDFSHIEKLSNFIPVVFFDRVITKEGIPAITCNDYDSGFKATQHLIEKGCSNIVFVGIADQISVTHARFLGYRDAVTASGCTVKPENILFCASEKQAVEKLKNALVHLQPDGIFSTVERYTLLLYSICNELNKVIPDDLRVISFFNSPTAALLAPPLSAIIHPATSMGEAAMEFLLQKIRNKKTITRDNMVIDCSFYFRKSSM